tara:strand:+ start:2807 stop:3871 length:1065 start_codon:yes stop_codon:yes gene_type:complete
MIKDKLFWKNKKVFITGHTGFKGSWLSLLLFNFGANLYGYSLKPNKNFLFYKAKLRKIFKVSTYANILDSSNLKKKIKKAKPSIVIHLAAQPLVLDSYKNPHKTFNTNIIGTLNLLEAARDINSIKVIIIVTTDKVYKIKKNNPFYNEKNILGASDPYGTSKACVEFLSETYKYSFFKKRKLSISTVRAGNVIGGGDFSKNRIVPDYLNSINKNKKLILRNPSYVRPWLYVLEPLYGYLLLARKKYSSKNTKFDSWNFAPKNVDSISVENLIKLFEKQRNKAFKTKILKRNLNTNQSETKILKLNSNKSKKLLNWKIKYSLKETTKNILKWNELIKRKSYFDVCMILVKDYINK